MRAVARKLRSEQTPSEELLWERLRYKQIGGYKFRRQKAIGSFIADFVCIEKKLIIELDGDVHLSLKARDAERDLYLKDSGYAVLRFRNHEVEQDMERVIRSISDSLNTTEAIPSPAMGDK
ncbi:MAG: endonuclease domain-containing protein [Nitrospirae bacterium]|nr:endonuclease domain-containing protein [Nitrospirota bacterium]